MKNKYINYVNHCIVCHSKLKGKRIRDLYSFNKLYSCKKCKIEQYNIVRRNTSSIIEFDIPNYWINLGIYIEKDFEFVFANYRIDFYDVTTTSSFKESFENYQNIIKTYIRNRIFE